MREPLPKSKTGLVNFDFNKFFCCKRLIYPKKDAKENCYMAFKKKNGPSCFFRDTHFRNLNLGYKILIQSEKDVEKCSCIEFKENR